MVKPQKIPGLSILFGAKPLNPFLPFGVGRNISKYYGK
jgi:hypothetical protein